MRIDANCCDWILHFWPLIRSHQPSHLSTNWRYRVPPTSQRKLIRQRIAYPVHRYTHVLTDRKRPDRVSRTRIHVHIIGSRMKIRKKITHKFNRNNHTWYTHSYLQIPPPIQSLFFGISHLNITVTSTNSSTICLLCFFLLSYISTDPLSPSPCSSISFSPLPCIIHPCFLLCHC